MISMLADLRGKAEFEESAMETCCVLREVMDENMAAYFNNNKTFFLTMIEIITEFSL